MYIFVDVKLWMNSINKLHFYIFTGIPADGATVGINGLSANSVLVDNRPRNKRWWDKSNTIRIFPLPRWIREPQILSFLQSAVASKPKYMHISVGLHINRALIVLSTTKQAIKCAEQLHHQHIGDYEVSIDIIEPIDYVRKQEQDIADNKWVTFTNLKHDVEEQDIMRYIQQKGGIIRQPNNIYLYHHPERMDVPGFAFVECQSPQCAGTLVDNLGVFMLKEQEVYCTMRSGKDVKKLDHENDRGIRFRKSTRWVRIGHLHHSLRENDIYKLVSRHGKVKELYCGYYQLSMEVS